MIRVHALDLARASYYCRRGDNERGRFSIFRGQSMYAPDNPFDPLTYRIVVWEDGRFRISFDKGYSRTGYNAEDIIRGVAK